MKLCKRMTDMLSIAQDCINIDECTYVWSNFC